MDCLTNPPPGDCGATIAFSCRGQRSKTGSKGRGKKRRTELAEDYEPWALRGFSGYLAADEVYDGPFCVLFAVDSNLQRRLAYEVLDHSPTQEDIERFFRRVARMLNLWGLTVSGVTTDGSLLYPDSIKNVWPKARHQICEFHVIKEITKDVLRVVAKLRKSLDAKIPKLSRGRPRTPEQKAQSRLAKQLREQIGELFEHRCLLVQHGLSPAEERIVRRLGRRHREIRQLRELMDAVYRLFDRRCRTEKALAKLAELRGKLSKFEHLGKVLSKIESPNIEKALTFLDDKMLQATSNSVERANRRHRKMQKSIYRVRTLESLSCRIALDMFRDKDMQSRTVTLADLHGQRAGSIGSTAVLARIAC